MNIAICFSPSWQQHIEVELYAISQTNPQALVYLVSNGISPERIARYEAIHNVKYIDFNPPSYQVRGRFTQYTMYRLSLPELIEDDQILYLDADTLVVDKLPEVNLPDDYLIGGVIDIGIRVSHRRTLGVTNYYNAGVLMMNLEQLRKEKIPYTWEYLATKRNFPCNDQDIINLTCKHSSYTIPSGFNVSKSTGLNSTPIIHHFAGKKTPWINKLPNYQAWKEMEESFNLYLPTLGLDMERNQT